MAEIVDQIDDQDSKDRFVGVLLEQSELPWSIESALDAVLQFGTIAVLKEKITTFLELHMNENSSAGTRYILELLKTDYPYALEVLVAGKFRYSSSVILEKTSDWDVNNLHRFYLLNGEKRKEEFHKIDDSEDMQWCLSTCDTDEALDLLHFALRSNRHHWLLEAYLGYLSSNSGVISYDEEIEFLATIGLESKILDLIPSVQAIKRPSAQTLYIRSLLDNNRFDDLEKYCKEADLADPETIAEVISSAKLSDPTPLIILCDRYGLGELLIDSLVTCHNSDYLVSYIENVDTKSAPRALHAMLENSNDPAKILNIRSVYSEPSIAIGCCEILLGFEKYDIIIHFVRKYKSLQDCPIIATIFAQALVLSNNAEWENISAAKAVDFRQVGIVAETSKKFDLAARCYAEAAEWKQCLSMVLEARDWSLLVELLSDIKCKPLWDLFDDRGSFIDLDSGRISQAFARLSDSALGVLLNSASCHGVGSTLLPSVKPLLDSTPALDGGVVLGFLSFFCAHEPDSLPVVLSKISADEFDQVFEFLLSRQLIDEAIKFSMANARYEHSLKAILEYKNDLLEAESLCASKGSSQLWSCFGKFLVRSQMFEWKDFLKVLVRGEVTDEWESVIRKDNGFDRHQYFAYAELLWKHGINGPEIAQIISVFLADQQDEKRLSEYISNCIDTDSLQVFGKVSFEYSFYRTSLAAFYKIRSAEWTVLALIRLGEYTESYRFIRMVKNPLVLLCLLESLLLAKNRDRRMIAILFSFLGSFDGLARPLLHIFEATNSLAVLESFDWQTFKSRGIYSAFLQLSAKYGILNGIDIRRENISEICAGKYWHQLASCIEYLSVDEAKQLTENASYGLSDSQYCHLASKFEPVFLRLLEERPNLLTKMDLVKGYDIFRSCREPYWSARKFSEQYGIHSQEFLTAAVRLHDYDIMQSRKQQLGTFVEQLMESPYRHIRLLASDLLFESKNYHGAVSCLVSEGDYVAAIRLGLISHSREVCHQVVRLFFEAQNHVMLFVSSMAFHKIIPEDVVLEYAWRAGIYNKFVPFVCQNIYERN